MNRIVPTGLVLILLVVTMAAGQAPAPLTNTIVRYLPSQQVAGMTYKLMITLPPGYEQGQQSYPVLYYLDAWMLAGVMHDSHLITSLLGAVEPVIMVGISFDADAPGFFYARARDYTPTKVPPEKLGQYAPMIPTSGGGPEFLEFLKRELIPFVETNYRADPADRGILGYSLGGLFAAWLARKEPSLFKRYGICSPSLHWDDALMMRLWGSIPELPEGTIMVFSQTEHENPEMKSAIDSLVSIVSKNPGVRVENFEVMGETHHSGVVATHMRALLLLYQKLQP